MEILLSAASEDDIQAAMNCFSNGMIPMTLVVPLRCTQSIAF